MKVLNIQVNNCIDNIIGYRGEVMLKFKEFGSRQYSIGDKVGQLIILPYPQIELLESKELSETARGDGGFGSTGK